VLTPALVPIQVPEQIPSPQQPQFPFQLPSLLAGSGSWGERPRLLKRWKNWSPLGIDISTFGPAHVPELRATRRRGWW
jgi:hypothetical protein